VPAEQGSPHCWKFCKVHTRPRFVHGFNLPYLYDYITELCSQQAEVIQNHENEYVLDIGQGEARHRKYSRLKHGGGQTYDRSSD
jgi:hypothetical protein